MLWSQRSSVFLLQSENNERITCRVTRKYYYDFSTKGFHFSYVSILKLWIQIFLKKENLTKIFCILKPIVEQELFIMHVKSLKFFFTAVIIFLCQFNILVVVLSHCRTFTNITFRTRLVREDRLQSFINFVYRVKKKVRSLRIWKQHETGMSQFYFEIIAVLFC